MQVRMIFGSFITNKEGKIIDLPAQEEVEVETKQAFALFAEGRAEPIDPTDKTYQAWLSKQPVPNDGPLNG